MVACVTGFYRRKRRPGDSSTGYKIAYELVERFPRATFAVMDAAGHLLERDALYQQLMMDWLERIEMGTSEIAKSRCPS